MKKVLLIFFALLSFLPLRAQTDFRPGYVVTYANDTLRGLIDYREGQKKYEACFFKRSPEATVEKFTAGAIQGYRFVHDKFFASKNIKSHADTFKTVFAEVIVHGEVSLFRYNDDFYVSKDTSALYRLANEKQIGYSNGKRVMLESNRYIGVLNFLMSDCSAVKSGVQHAKLFERNLTELVEQYNRCHTGKPTTYKSGVPFMNASVGLLGGANVSHLSFGSGSSTDRPLGGTFQTSVTSAGGVFVDLSSPRVNQRIAFHVGILYAHSTYHSYRSHRRLYLTDRDYITLEEKRFQIPLGIRYSFPEKKYTPYISGGLVGSFNISSDSQWIRETEVDHVVETYERSDIRLGRSKTGVWAGFGIRRSLFPLADILLEFRYVNMPGSLRTFEPVSDARPSISGFQIFLGIRTK